MNGQRDRGAPREVLARVQQLLTDEGLDALVCSSPENIAYAAGFVIPSQVLMRWRHAAWILTAAGEESILCVDMEETTVRAKAGDTAVRTWTEFGGDAMASLADMLTDLGQAGGRVGLETGYLAAADYQRLVARLPQMQVVAADPLLVDSRRIKTSAELDLLTRLSVISDTAVNHALGSVRAGDTEMDIAAQLTRSVYEQGAQSFKLLIVATGPRSELPNVGPTNRVLTAGDVCRVEIFSVIDGYQAGVCRTATVGDPPPHAERIYTNLAECKEIVREALSPGASTRRVYEKYLTKFGELGLEPISFVAHSIGVNLHESPYVGPHRDDTLQAGMVFGMEPLAYRTGYGFGMQIKDMITITDSGSRILSDVTDTTRPFLIEA